MTKNKRNQILTVTAAIVLIVIAWLCRIQRSGNIRGWIRCIIQCGLLIAWSISIRKRIISPKVRGYLLTIAALFGFWLLDRTVKYTLLKPFPTLTRYAWYLYYIPQLLLPVFLLFSAFCLRKSEDYRLPRISNLFFVPAVIGIVLVLSNDLHQAVFSFPGGIPNEGNSYSYKALYYVIMALYFSEIVAFFIIMIKKCRFSKRRKLILLPIVPIFLLIVYGIVYVVDYDLVARPLGDMTAVNCLLAVLSLEACIYKGLIPSNTHYDELFSSSMVSAQITDTEYNTILSSTDAQIPTETKKRTQNAPVMLDGNIRLSGKAIRGGNVLWTEDISELVDTVSKLEELDGDLSQKEQLSSEEYRTRYEHQRLIEKNRFYNLMKEQTKSQFGKLSELLAELKATDDKEKTRHIMAEIAVIIAYLKRRNNLIFLAEENDVIPAGEILYCLKESLDKFRFFGTDYEIQMLIKEAMPFKAIAELYNAFETVAEFTMDRLKSIFVTVRMKNGTPTILMNIVSDADLTPLSEQKLTVENEDDNEWTVEYSFAEDGYKL